jgi:alkyl sulfatase BDS1-like metallo-beta-lactamase superfamily hydrolase
MLADFADRTDFENANRGLVARLEPGVIAIIAGLTDQPDHSFAIVTP